MEGDANDTDFAGYPFAAPREIAGIETEGAVFGVAAASADEVYTLVANTGIGWLTALLEGSVDSQGSFLESHRERVYLFLR